MNMCFSGIEDGEQYCTVMNCLFDVELQNSHGNMASGTSISYTYWSSSKLSKVSSSMDFNPTNFCTQ